MKYILIIFSLIVFWSCTSCNSNDSKNDLDLISDKDSIIDIDIQDTNPDEFSDSDQISPDSDISIPDSDINDEFIDDCDPKLIDAPFPYYDKDGKITFCRPGCDTPTEKDPQCMSNLWREQNYNLCHQHPEYDCCGYPCVIGSLKPVTKKEEEEIYKENAIVMHKCDLKINPRFWGNDGTMGVVKSWNISEGKIGFHMVPSALDILEWPVKRKAVTYDIATKRYSLIAPAAQMQAYYKSHRIVMSGDKRSLPIETRKSYLAYFGDDGSYRLAYDKSINFLAYEPALNDKWAFVNLQETETSSYKMMYAKVGVWKWTVLGEGTARYSDLYENNLGIYDENRNGYICDLSKTPKLLSDCLKINRGSETVAIIRINRSNSKEFAYNSNGKTIVKGTINNEIIEYENIITEFDSETSKNGYSISPYQLSGDMMLYVQVTNDGSTSGGLLCYYRIDKNKKYCMKKMDKDESYADGTTRYPYGFSEFEGKWLLYQKMNSTPLILRDMECYCKEEGVCPFEE